MRGINVAGSLVIKEVSARPAPGRLGHPVIMAERKFLCGMYYSMGYSARQIGSLLGISYVLVHQYLVSLSGQTSSNSIRTAQTRRKPGCAPKNYRIKNSENFLSKEDLAEIRAGLPDIEDPEVLHFLKTQELRTSRLKNARG